MSVRERLAAAIAPGDSDVPDVRTRDSRLPFFGSGRPGAERHEPPKDEYDRYWRQYETTPLIRAPVNHFSSDVTSPGYRIQCSNEEAAEYARDWAKRCAIVAGQEGCDLGDFIDLFPAQYIVRGTVLIEHVPAEQDENRLAAVKYIPPSTVTPYTHPGSSRLIRPGDTDVPDVKTTENGNAAAYVQYDRANGYSDDDENEIRLTAEDVTKVVNDPDVSDIFGTSDIEAVSDRVEALRNKLQDNEDAVRSMAWGQWFFGFEPMELDDGTLVEWSDEAQEEFMDDLDDIEPGDQIGHDGTIDVENIPGEVAEIIDLLQFDVDYIVSAMPSPLYSVGFEKNINQFVTDAQEERLEQRISDMRRTIEQALTPILKRVVREAEFTDVEDLTLRVEPEKDASPILSMSVEETEKLYNYARAVSELGGGDAFALLDDDTIREMLLQLPEDTSPLSSSVEPLTAETLEQYATGDLNADGTVNANAGVYGDD